MPIRFVVHIVELFAFDVGNALRKSGDLGFNRRDDLLKIQHPISLVDPSFPVKLPT